MVQWHGKLHTTIQDDKIYRPARHSLERMDFSMHFSNFRFYTQKKVWCSEFQFHSLVRQKSYFVSPNLNSKANLNCIYMVLFVHSIFYTLFACVQIGKVLTIEISLIWQKSLAKLCLSFAKANQTWLVHSTNFINIPCRAKSKSKDLNLHTDNIVDVRLNSFE